MACKSVNVDALWCVYLVVLIYEDAILSLFPDLKIKITTEIQFLYIKATFGSYCIIIYVKLNNYIVLSHYFCQVVTYAIIY